ncbi:Response regulator receiver domain-containing protein [Sarcina sp. DSM 11001]|uniref:response regulator transcription factor n=1 Tax=Sarcina sp. DSM 11001 TaxID=1798184 RepID=UPI00087E93C8|nr:response regulator [Sarcina sp. DSM 11001]SDM02217.1 Response regulator receiver domain-containing protein [Sarcina sp. DSM 11001]
MKTILIIEDNEHIRKANAEYLRLCDYEVLEAPTLEKARDELSRCKPDLIILDNELPDGYGVSFLKELRRALDIPVIMISAEGGTNGEREAIRCGADVYLRKPYAMEELLHHVAMLTN